MVSASVILSFLFMYLFFLGLLMRKKYFEMSCLVVGEKQMYDIEELYNRKSSLLPIHGNLYSLLIVGLSNRG